MASVNKNSPVRVVVLGAGFGGLAAAHRLSSGAKYGELELTLIDRSADHIYTPLMYEVATGFLDCSERKYIEALVAGVSIPLIRYARSLPIPADFIKGEVRAVDRLNRLVELSDGRTTAYDYLVSAFGSSVDDRGVIGVRAHALAMKRLEDVLAIRARLYRYVRAHLENKKERLEIVICGAGPVGVEFAAELGSFLERLRQHEIVRRRHATITLIEFGRTILSTYDMTLQRVAENRLRTLGVDILTETSVKEIKRNGVVVIDRKILGDDSGARTIDADLVIWAAGVRAATANECLGFDLDARGRVVVDATFRSAGEERVFVIGDSAAHTPMGAKYPLPALAQVATFEGRKVAENILRSIRGQKIEDIHLPNHWSTVVPLGGKSAIAQIGRFQFHGWMAYLFRKLADLAYLLEILPITKAFIHWWKGMLAYQKND